MKKSIITISFIVFLFVAFFYIGRWFFNKYEIAHKHNPKKISKVAPLKFYKVATAPLNLKATITSAPVTKNNKTPSLKPEIIPPYCQDQWDRLISKELWAFKDEIKTNYYNTKELNYCFKFIPHSDQVKGLIKEYCKKETETLCLSSLMMLRALLIDLSTQDDKFYSRMTVAMLLNKITGRIIQSEEDLKPAINDLQAMALAIKEMEPDNPSSYRVLGIIEILNGEYKNAEKFASLGLELDSTDIYLKDIWFYTQGKNDNFNLANYIEANPNEDMALYYYAGQLFKKGKIIESQNIMKKLVQAHPENDKYKLSFEKIMKSNNPKDRAFKIEIPIILDEGEDRE